MQREIMIDVDDSDIFRHGLTTLEFMKQSAKVVGEYWKSKDIGVEMFVRAEKYEEGIIRH